MPDESPRGRVGLFEAQLREICEHLAADIRHCPEPAVDGIAVDRAMDMLLAVVSRALVKDPSAQTDEFGRARAGSQLQMQLYANLFPDDLNAAILGQLPELAGRQPRIEWVSPLTADRYREYRNGDFLARLGLESLVPKLTGFWPDRGPRWDGLARLRLADQERPGVLLVEAKSHITEVASSGCDAGDASRKRIEQRLMGIASRFGMSDVPESWLGEYYQAINRLAHLFFLRDQGVDAWLANVYFADDWYKPTTDADWRAAIEFGKRAMAIPTSAVRRGADVILPAKKLMAHSLPVKTGTPAS